MPVDPPLVAAVARGRRARRAAAPVRVRVRARVRVMARVRVRVGGAHRAEHGGEQVELGEEAQPLDDVAGQG